MNYYQPPYYPPMYNQYYSPAPMQNAQMGMPIQQPTQSVQTNSSVSQPQPMIQTSNDFVLVKSKEEAMNYPVALGTCVTFKNENEPYIYTKTMGFSQFDKPQFEAIRLVKENENESNEQIRNIEVKEESQPIIDTSVFDNKIENINETIQLLDEEMKETKVDIDYLKNRVEELSKRRKTSVKKVGEEDV